jgi:hypothetical protein
MTFETHSLWKQCESDTRDALNLMLTPNAPDVLHKILGKLRTATAAMQDLERQSKGRGEGQCH